MKKLFTLFLLMLCFAFTNYAQVQIGNSLMGSAAGVEFGKTVSINAAGTRISVVAPNEGSQGAVHFYDYSGTSWEEMAIGGGLLSVGTMNRLAGDGNSSTHFVPSSILSLTVFNTNTQQWNFGSNIQNPTIESLDIAISADGQRVISGGETQTRIFEKDANGNWTQLGQSIPQRADFVDISGDGSRIVISDTESTLWRIYEYNTGTSIWDNVYTSLVGDLGADVAMSNDGNRFGVRSTFANLTFVVSFNPVGDVGNGIPVSTDDVNMDLSADGNRIVIASKGSEKATKLYEYDGTSWVQIGETIEFSGDEVAISADGTIVVIGDASANNNQGEVRVYDFSLSPTPGNECADAIDINDLFGGAVNEPQVTSLYDNTNYTSEASDPTTGHECFEDSMTELDRTMWYSFTGDGNKYQIRTIQCGAIDPGDMQAAIYSGECGSLVSVSCNEDEDYGQGLYNAFFEIETEDGVDYELMVDGFDGNVPNNSTFCLEVVQLEPNAVTNISQTSINVFPNPTTGLIQLQNVNADVVEIFDNTGRVVKTIAHPGNSLDISAMTAGFYFLKMYEGEKVFSTKVIKE